MNKIFAPLCFLLCCCSSVESVVYENNPNDFAPSISPDGTKLLYYTYRNGPPHIYYYDLITKREHQVTNHQVYWDFNPTWGTDNKILFQSDRNGGMGIYMTDLSGKDVRQVISDTLWNATPAMSRDGSKIAYSSRASRKEKFNIKVYDLVSKETTTITHSPGHSIRPEWSPDDKMIYFHSDRYGTDDLFAMNIDGSNVQRLTDGESNENTPRISPDGTRILFASNDSFPKNEYKQRTSELYVMNADGTQKQRLTNNNRDEFFPSWTEDGSGVVYSSDFVKNGKHYFKLYQTSLIDWSPKRIIK